MTVLMRSISAVPRSSRSAARRLFHIPCQVNNNHQPRRYSSAASDKPISDSRWLHDFQARVGKCINFGLNAEQVDRVGRLVREVSQDWRALLVGVEGFLTSRERAGLLRQAVVWGEQDSMGHVNNVIYNRWAESGRVEWVENFARFLDRGNARQWRELGTPQGVGMILRSIKTDFKFPMKYPDRVSVFHKLSTQVAGESEAFVLDVVILSEKQRRVSARCIEDIVMYDYRAAKKVKLTQAPFALKGFGETFHAQGIEARRRLDQRQKLTDMLRQLELESWDRPDAIEDFGSAA